MRNWIKCGAEFMENDVIRWQESVFRQSHMKGGKSVRLGKRLITAQVLFDPRKERGNADLQVLASEGKYPVQKDTIISRCRRTLSKEDTERLLWSDEGARTVVLTEQAPVQQQVQAVAGRGSPQPAQSQPAAAHRAGGAATGAPWRKKRGTTYGI